MEKEKGEKTKRKGKRKRERQKKRRKEKEKKTGIKMTIKRDEEEENGSSIRWIVILSNYDTLKIQLNLSLTYFFFLKPQNPKPCYSSKKSLL